MNSFNPSAKRQNPGQSEPIWSGSGRHLAGWVRLGWDLGGLAKAWEPGSLEIQCGSGLPGCLKLAGRV
jgi:hypothetical protein